jgi:hypothetical protein
MKKNNVITDTVRAAIQDGRRQLQSFGSSLVSFMGQKQAALLKLPGGRNAAEITTEQRRIEDERFKIEQAAAQEALDLAEDKTSAQLDLDQLLLDRQQSLRERSLSDSEANNKRQIDDLIEEFNRGKTSAATFQTSLQNLLGADFGSELGIGFSGAFKREFDSIIALATDIIKTTTAGGERNPLAADAPSVSSTLKAENDRRYQEALDDWNEDQKRFNDLKAKRKKGEITQETLNNFVNRQKPGRPKPVRKAFGLAMGGILKQPTFVAGEAGREAVIPLESSSAMKILRDAIGGGGGSTVVYNLVVNAGLGTDPDDLGRTIVESIKRYEKRNGAVFQGPIVTTLANAAGKTSTASAATDFNRAKTLRSG